MQQLLAAMNNLPATDVSAVKAIEYLGHSALLGGALMLATVWANYSGETKVVQPGQEPPDTPADLMLNSSNVLFLCFGMTGVMLLVNNNLARAFAIGAAIALVRFRIKVDSKTLSMALFYGVLTGMACGVGEIAMAYSVAAFFGVLQFVVVSAARFIEKRTPHPAIAAPSTQTEVNPVPAAAIALTAAVVAAPINTVAPELNP